MSSRPLGDYYSTMIPSHSAAFHPYEGVANYIHTTWNPDLLLVGSPFITFSVGLEDTKKQACSLFVERNSQTRGFYYGRI